MSSTSSSGSQFSLLRERRFGPFFWTQFLGAGNDNVFKFAFTILVTFQAAEFGGGDPKTAAFLIGAVFIAPFVLFSATAGQLADKLEKSFLIRVVKNLEKAGIDATAMHADKSQGQRTAAIEAFKAGKVRVLVATDIAQRGLDITGITHVINYDVPQQAEDYVHRIGRTGRAAMTGDAYTFMCADEIAMVRTIERVIQQQIPRVSVAGFDFGTVAASPAEPPAA